MPDSTISHFSLIWATKAHLNSPGRRTTRTLLMANSIRGEIAYFSGDVWTWFVSAATAALHSSVGDRGGLGMARGLALTGFLAGLLRLKIASRFAFRLGHKAFEGHPDRRLIAFVQTSEAVLEVVFARWRNAETLIASGLQNARAAREPHAEEVLLSLTGLKNYFLGDTEASAECFRRLLASASRRGNELHEAWGHYGQAQAVLGGGDAAGAAAHLASAYELKARHDKQSELICAGLRAQIALVSNPPGEAFAAANECLALSNRLRPTNFSSLEGYAAPSIVLSSLVREKALRPDDEAIAMRGAVVSLKQLDRFATLIPIGRPRKYYCHALVALAQGRRDAAARNVRLARKLGVEMQMQREVDLAVALERYL